MSEKKTVWVAKATQETTKFIVKSSAARMPPSCWGTYRRVAVLEVAVDAPEPRMISDRARGVVAVVRTWERRSVGSTARCAYQVAMMEAAELAAQLNEGAGKCL